MKYTEICYRESESEQESEESEDSGESEDTTSEDVQDVKYYKEDYMYIDPKKRLRTRNPPTSMAKVMSELTTDAQIESLKEIGFNMFAGYKLKKVPAVLAKWILVNYNPNTSILDVGDVKMEITSQTVHDIFGLPIGGREIVELNQAKKTDEVIEEWRVQFNVGKGGTIKPSTVADKILENMDDVGRMFQLNFLVLFVTQMMEITTCGTVNQRFLTCLTEDTDIKKFDWCAYLLKCLKRTRINWKGGYYNGPSTFLTVSI